jgi:hypothetical protein
MIAFLVIATVASVALGWQLLRLARLAIRRSPFLEHIEKLVRARNLERAIKLSQAHAGPVAQLCHAALSATQAGHPVDLELPAAGAVANARWMQWPPRIVGVAAIGVGALLLARTPYSRKDATFAVVGGWSVLLAMLLALTFRAQRRLVADIGKTVKRMSQLAHVAAG